MILSQPAARHQTERFIYQQRNKDHQNDKLQTKLKQEFYEKEFAKFENKGRIVEKSKYVQQRLSQMRAQSRAELNQRRARLAQKLNEEHQVFKQEIKDLEETPEQVRAKMQQRVAQLKEEKEGIRKAYVEQQLERRFLQNADELRKVDQEYNELKALQERNIQMMEKQKLLEDNYEKEMIYAQLYKREINKKERVELKKLEESKQKIQERANILNAQLDMNQNRRQALVDETNQEKQMLNNEWQKEKERHIEQMKSQQEFMKQLNTEIKSSNEEQQQRKSDIKNSEKQQDKVWVDGVVQKEKILDYLENQQKKKQALETQTFMKNQAARNNETEIFEKEAERIAAIEAEKQYLRQKAVWDREEQARINLMYKVYEDREVSIVDKQNTKQVEGQEKNAEKDILNKAVEDYEEECERKRIEELEANKQHQKSILTQVSDKQTRIQQQLNQKAREEQEEQQRKREYEVRIQAKKEEGRKLLDELRKQRPF